MFKVRAAVLLALAGALFAACATPDPPPPTRASTGRELAPRIAGVPGLANLARVNPGFYRGAQPDAEGYRALKAMGVKTVICLRSWHSSKKETESAGLAYVELPLQADAFGSHPPSDDQIRLFFKTVLDPARQPVYIHCAHGKDRTGTMCALYRIEVDGWTPGEAIEEMQSFGYHDIYRDLLRFVRNYTPRGFRKP